MRTIQELEKDLEKAKEELREATQKKFDIMSLINNYKALERARMIVKKDTEKLKNEKLSNDDFRLYLKKRITKATVEDIPNYLERIEYFEKKLGYRD